MKNSGLLLLMLIGLFGASDRVCALTIRCRHATVQQWSGGIAGRYGSYISFEIEMIDEKQVPVPDSAWLENEGFALHVRGSTTDPGGNMKVVKNGRSTTFSITWKTYHDQFAHEPGSVKMPADGVICISYMENGRKKYYAIKKYTQVLEPIAYP